LTEVGLFSRSGARQDDQQNKTELVYIADNHVWSKDSSKNGVADVNQSSAAPFA